MSRNKKLITALLSTILCFSICSFTAFAVDADGDGYDDMTGEYIGGEVIVTDPVYTDPIYTDPVVIQTDPVVIETEPVVIQPETVATEYVPDYTQPVQDDPQNNQDVVQTDPPEIYWDVEEENNETEDGEVYVGGGQTYVEPVETAPSAALYDSNHKIDDSELSDNDWNEIALNLKNASASDSDDDGDDFNFIKKNDSTSDNGDWMLFLGLGLLLLGIAGIVYVIASAVIRRKKMKNMPSGQLAAATSGAGRYRSNNDYGDGFKNSGKKDQKKLDRSRKFDTADVKLPKNSGGKRFK